MKNVLTLTAALLLCSTLQAQSPHKPIHKPKAAAPVPPSKPEIFKEFAVLGLKACSRIDRLKEQILEIKTPRDRGDLEEMSPEPVTWSLRVVEAETTVDDLQAAAQTKLEKDIADIVKLALYWVQQAHTLYESQTEIDMLARNATTLTGTTFPALDATNAREKATNLAATSSSCIQRTREALDAAEITPEMRIHIAGCAAGAQTHHD